MSNNGKDNSNPFANAILLNLSVRKMGDRKTVKEEVVAAEVEVDSDKELLGVSKKIFQCEQYDAVKTVINDVRDFLKRRSLPCKFVKGGVYAIPLSFVERVNAEMLLYEVKYKAAVRDFVAAYSDAVSQAMGRLNVLGDSGDYVSVGAVEREFSLTWEFLTMGPPAELEDVSAEIWKQEKEKAQAMMRSAAGDVQEALRNTFEEMVGHIAECLKPNPDGSKKKFKAASVDKLKEFLADFDTFNITNDGEMAVLVRQAKALLDGNVDAVTLRKDDSLREATAQKLDEIKSSMTSLVTSAKRALVLED